MKGPVSKEQGDKSEEEGTKRWYWKVEMGKLHSKHIWRRQDEVHDFIQWRRDNKDLKKAVTGRLLLWRKSFNRPSWRSSRKKEKHSIQQKQLSTRPLWRCGQFSTLPSWENFTPKSYFEVFACVHIHTKMKATMLELSAVWILTSRS